MNPFLSVSSNPSSSSSPTDHIVISPNMLITISIISFIFYICALLQLLISFLLRNRTQLEDPYDEESTTALQDQTLNIHNSGVDQSVIDALPLFRYKTLIGLRLRHDSFDCSVCLSEFKDEDELRLLPKCSHTFHMNCIDTWLLTNSTCPLCRDDITASSSHVVIAVEPDGESFRDSVLDLELAHLDDVGSKSCDISGQNDGGVNDERVVLVL